MKQIIEEMGVTDILEIPNEFPTYTFYYISDNLKVRGFIIFPKKILAKNPVVIINRGGTRNFGIFNSENIGHYSFLAKNGYITLMSQYRGCDGGEGIDRMGGDDIFDVINLYGLMSKTSFIDINRIGMWGVSRGGMMAFQTIARVSWVKALVVVSPLLDEVHMSTWRPGWKEHQYEIYGGSYSEQYRRSPILWTDQIPKIPTLLFVGMKDDKIDPNKVIEMGKILNSPTVIFPDDGHHISKKTIEKSVDFFNRNL